MEKTESHDLPLRPLKAIRAKCLDCMCDQQAEVRRCPVNDCPLWPYRMGHRPAKEVYGEDGGDEKTPEKPGENEGNWGTSEEGTADAVC